MTGKTFIDILEQLEKTTGTNDKIAILKANSKNEILKTYLFLAMDDRVTFGIKKLPDILGSGRAIETLEESWINFTTLCKKLIERDLTGGNAEKEITKFLSGTDNLWYKWYRKCIQRFGQILSPNRVKIYRFPTLNTLRLRCAWLSFG